MSRLGDSITVTLPRGEWLALIEDAPESPPGQPNDAGELRRYWRRRTRAVETISDAVGAGTVVALRGPSVGRKDVG